jgi:hypothetical protein
MLRIEGRLCQQAKLLQIVANIRCAGVLAHLFEALAMVQHRKQKL